MPDLLPTFTCWRCGAECDVSWIDVGTLGSIEPEVVQGVTRCTNERCIGRFDRSAHHAPTPDQLVERGRRWVRSYTDGLEYLEDLDGVDWFDAPPPPRRHRCSAQTRGRMLGGFLERCACGAVRMDRIDPWFERNQRSAAAPARTWRRWLCRRR